jgi:vacuolar-type H+-ATPase subunit I/STV1
MVGETHLDETANSACDLYKLIGKKMKQQVKEFNYLKYKEDTINNSLKKYSSKHEPLFDEYERTIFNMDAKIQSLITENDALREMVDWNDDSL